jgi:hypothetical protein
MTHAEAIDRFGAAGSPLRVGRLADWTFCFEELGTEGIKDQVLARLSAGTETLSLFAASGKSWFQHYRDGRRVELFEPGLDYTTAGSESHHFWDATQQLSDRIGAADGPLFVATLDAIADHVGQTLDEDTLRGLLLTVASPQAVPLKPSPAPCVPLGPMVGTLAPGPLPGLEPMVAETAPSQVDATVDDDNDLL